MTTDHRALVAELRELLSYSTPQPWGMSDLSAPLRRGDLPLALAAVNALSALLTRLELLEAVADVAPDTLHRGKAYNPKCCISCAAKAALNNALNALENSK